MKTTNEINFKAHPLYNVKIKKFNSSKNKFLSCKATFIKLDANNNDDIEAAVSAANNWQPNIDMKRIATATRWMDYVPIDVYALTTQDKDFDKLDYTKILGFAEMRNDTYSPNYKLLYHLQVKPEAINVNRTKNMTHKKVGTAIINSLKKIYSRIALFSVNNLEVQKFYTHNNFVRDLKIDSINSRYVWSANALEMLILQIKNFFASLSKI